MVSTELRFPPFSSYANTISPVPHLSASNVFVTNKTTKIASNICYDKLLFSARIRQKQQMMSMAKKNTTTIRITDIVISPQQYYKMLGFVAVRSQSFAERSQFREKKNVDKIRAYYK